MIAASVVSGPKWMCERSYKPGAKSTAQLCEVRMRQGRLGLEAERDRKGGLGELGLQ